MASAEFTSPGADTIEEVQLASDEQSLSPELSDVLSDGKEPASSGYEPQFEGHEELPAELQPEINLLESTGDAEPGLDFIDSTDSEIETSSHSGIADLNRVLISLK